MKNISAVFVAVLFSSGLSFIPRVYAHHAKEFIETESYKQAYKNQVVILNQFDYAWPEIGSQQTEEAAAEEEDEADGHEGRNEWEYTPTILYGISDRIMMNAHGHLKDVHGESPFVEAGTLGFQFQLTKPAAFPVDIGMSMDYEFPLNRSRRDLDGTDVLTETLIVSKELPHDMNVTANFGADQHLAYGGEPEWFYRLGVKGPISRKAVPLEGGLEVMGNFASESPELKLIPGLYFGLPRGFVFKAGLGIGLTRETDDLNMTFTIIKLFG